MSENKTSLVPAEWARQRTLWTCWPSHPELWAGALLEEARSEIAQMVAAIAAFQPVKILCHSEPLRHPEHREGSDMSSQILHFVQNDKKNIEIIPARFGDIWLRDTGPIFTKDHTALRFQTNGWGGKYVYEFDDEVGDTVAAKANAPIKRHDFVLEGGALEHNGAGAILTTRQCLLSPNRNGWDETQATNALKNTFGVETVYWLDDGLLNDHTDGHIDNLARFVDEKTVLCQSAYGSDDPNAGLYEKTAKDLKAMGLDVVQIPSPGLVVDETGWVQPASHMNFIITNGVVVVPVYGTQSADNAVSAIAELFPTRKVIGVSSRAVLTGGGSFHCITQQEPA